MNEKKHTCTSICPSLEFLENQEIVTNVVCTVPNCEEIFLNQSNLNFHLEKVHRIKANREQNELVITKAKSKSQKIQENCECKYYCPVTHCKFFIGSDRFLPTFHSLKNHFIRIHGAKSFSCSKCKKSFSIKSEMERHEDNCGIVFKCSCGCPYSSRLALLKHARLKNHELPEELKDANTSQPTFQAQKTKTIQKTEQKLAPKILRPQQPVKIQPSTANSLNESTQFVFIPVSLSSNTSQINTPYTENQQRSFGCQTKLHQTANNDTQEIACQTIYYNFVEIEKNSDQESHQEYHSSMGTMTNYSPYLTNASTSTQLDSINDPFYFSNNNDTRNNQSQKTQTLSSQILQNNDDYMNMIISDISTQTQLTSFSTVYSQTGMDSKPMFMESPIDEPFQIQQTENREIQTSQVNSNTACTQTSQALYLNEVNQQTVSESVNLNLEFTNLDQDVYFSTQEINDNNNTSTETSDYYQIGTHYSNNGIDFMTQTNMEFSGVTSSSQTDEFYFNSYSNNLTNSSTNSIQTQTAFTSYYNEMSGIDTITQTENKQ